ncbi:MAG: divalent-cation tolerance protein CutA [Acidobacteria bacterium]|nr:divalent-cation tolerance protein CutA [Acidobacteriota bacterium]
MREAGVVLCTTDTLEQAETLAGRLVQEGLAACVNVIPTLTSFYIWREKLRRDSESLLVIKTFRDVFPRLAERLRDLHPYEVPEIIFLGVRDGARDYLAWMDGQIPASDADRES